MLKNGVTSAFSDLSYTRSSSQREQLQWLINSFFWINLMFLYLTLKSRSKKLSHPRDYFFVEFSQYLPGSKEASQILAQVDAQNQD